MSKSPIGRKAINIILADVTAVRIMMAIVAALFSVGFLVAKTEGGAYDAMLSVASPVAWAAAFAFYAVAKIVIALHLAAGIPKPVLFLFVLFGLTLWLFTFLSFTSNSVRPYGAADITVLAMVIGEVWVGAHTLADAENES